MADFGKKWAGRAAFSAIDQAAVSGANFLVIILLARWMPPQEFGAFAITQAFFFVASGFYVALVSDPTAVLGPTRFALRAGSYRRILVRIHLVFSASVVSTLLLVRHLASPAPTIDAAILGLAVGLPGILLFWLFRRLCYLEARSGVAAAASTFSAVVIVAGMFGLFRFGALTIFTAFAVLSAGSVAAALLIGSRLRASDAEGLQIESITEVDVVQAHWRYGKWGVASSITYSLSATLYIPLIGAFAGAAAAGVYRALQNLTTPIGQIIAAAALLVLPGISAKRHELGTPYLRTVLPRLAASFTLLSLSIGAVLWIAGDVIVQVAYQDHSLMEYGWLLKLLVVAIVFESVKSACHLVLAAAERTRDIFVSWTWGAAATALLGVPLVWTFGLAGAAIAFVISNVLVFISSLVLARRIAPSTDQQPIVSSRQGALGHSVVLSK